MVKAKSREALPMDWRIFGHLNKTAKLSANGSGQCHLMRYPVFMSFTMVGIPPTLDAITGVPHDIASNATKPKLS